MARTKSKRFIKMQIVASTKKNNVTNNVYKVNSQTACNFINWIDSQKHFTYQNFSKGNFHAIGNGVSVRYCFTRKLLTITTEHKKNK